MLTESEIWVIAILVAFLMILLTTRLKIELMALLVLVTLSFTGLVTTQQALSGFSSSVVITLIGLFVITHTLEETGVVQSMADKLDRIGQGAEARYIIVFMMAGTLLSLIMNNVAAGAVLLPAAVQVAKTSKVRVSKLLLPMSFGTLVGGMATYFTTANIVMSELLENRGLDGLNMFDFLPTGGLIALAGLAYMLGIGRYLLPERSTLTQTLVQSDLKSTYHLEERFWELQIPKDSPLAYKTLAEIGIGEKFGLMVLIIWHDKQTLIAPIGEQIIKPLDKLLVLGRKTRVDELLTWGTKLLSDAETIDPTYKNLLGDLVEIVIAPRSNAVGKTLAQLRFRQQFGMMALAIYRETKSFRTDVGKTELKVGDALLLMGKPDNIDALMADKNYIVTSSNYPAVAKKTSHAPIAIVITVVVLVLAILELMPLPVVMLAGAAFMVLTGCLEMEAFYSAIEWRVIFLIAGLLPLSLAIVDTGLADHITQLVVRSLANANPLVFIGGMVVLTMLIVQIMGGQTTALLIGPIAITTALQMNIDPQAMAVAVAIACSMAFLTPIAHPVNILMMGPGGYEFKDFFRVGFGMTLVSLFALILGLMIFWSVG